MISNLSNNFVAIVAVVVIAVIVVAVVVAAAAIVFVQSFKVPVQYTVMQHLHIGARLFYVIHSPSRL